MSDEGEWGAAGESVARAVGIPLLCVCLCLFVIAIVGLIVCVLPLRVYMCEFVCVYVCF